MFPAHAVAKSDAAKYVRVWTHLSVREKYVIVYSVRLGVALVC